MNLTHQWMQSDWGRALGWTFIHSLWQIAVIGLLLYMILKWIPGRSAHIRYTISTMAIWMIVITVLSTFIIMLPESSPLTEINSQVIYLKSTNTISLTDRISIWLEARMPVMLSIWFGGVIILMLRLIFSLAWVQHMRSTAAPLGSIQNIMNDLIHRLQLHIKPNASETGYVSSPVTIGHFKPMILFPIGIINQLTPQEVEAILTHELAHIVRRDYLSNLIQSFIETLFYYHPVTWWISNMVRTERENRADDLAISWCGDHLGYAKALLTVQEMQLGNTPSLAIGFASKKGAMLARIQRILHIPYKNHNQMEKTVLISLCSLFFLGFTLHGHNDQQKKRDNISNETEIVLSRHAVPDSIPTEGTYRIHKKTDNQDISIEVKDGNIKQLHVDGKEIAPSDFDQYGKVIDDLFGEVDTPPTMEGFNFQTPPMPPTPDMPSSPDIAPMAPMTFSFAMPAMPPMPPMPPMNEIEIEHSFGDSLHMILFNDGNPDSYGLNQLDDINVTADSLGPRCSKIIIIRNGDTSVIVSPHVECTGGAAAMNMDQYIRGKSEWKAQEEYLKQLNKELKENYKDFAQDYSNNWQQYAQEWNDISRDQQEKMKAEQEELRAQGDHMKYENIQGYNNEDENRARQEEIEAEGLGRARAYGFFAPRMNMTESMVEDGLVNPGDEAEIILTPDKLKINGKKMPDDVHEKYLKMYEDQQGVELSGNSRVEFKTKSHRSM